MAKKPATPRKRRAKVPAGPTPAVERNGEPHYDDDGPTPERAPAKEPSPYLYGDEIKAAKVRWLWPAFVPEGLPVVVYGPSLSGKSTVLAALAAAVTNGTAPTGKGDGIPGKVAWLAGEELIDSMVIPRLKAAGARMERVCFPQEGRGERVGGWYLLENRKRFEELVTQEEIDLLVIDPIATFLGSAHPPESNLAARHCYSELTRIGRETGCATVFVKHPRKSGRGSSTEQMSGGLEWFNTPRCVLLCGRHPHDSTKRVIVNQKPSLTAEASALEYRIEDADGAGRAIFLRDASVIAGDVLSEELSTVERSALDEAKDFLRQYLRESERRTTDLQRWAQECGHSWITVRRAKVELGVVPEWRSEDGTKHVVWTLPAKGGL